MTKHHYVYCSCEEWGRDYIGRRSCDCLPEEDTKYFGSFKDKTFSPTEKTILFVCKTRKEAAEIEIKLHDFFDVAVNPKFANRAKATSTKFDTTGVPTTEETRKKQSVANTGQRSYMYGVPKSKAHKRAQSEKMSGEKHPNYGNTGALNPLSKPIIAIEPDGTQRHFGSVHGAAKELKMNRGNLSTYLESGHVLTRGDFKGWQFFYENP